MGERLAAGAFINDQNADRLAGAGVVLNVIFKGLRQGGGGSSTAAWTRRGLVERVGVHAVRGANPGRQKLSDVAGIRLYAAADLRPRPTEKLGSWGTTIGRFEGAAGGCFYFGHFTVVPFRIATKILDVVIQRR